MKKSDQKKLLKSSEKIFNRLTNATTDSLDCSSLVFLGYFFFTNRPSSFSQEKVIKVNNADALLKLNGTGLILISS
jgi:DNA-entry nuclease